MSSYNVKQHFQSLSTASEPPFFPVLSASVPCGMEALLFAQVFSTSVISSCVKKKTKNVREKVRLAWRSALCRL